MMLTTDQEHQEMDLPDLMLRNTSCQNNQLWDITTYDHLNPHGSSTDDFLESLLGRSTSSSASASPLWSHCTTDSDIYEDPLSDPTDSPNSSTSIPGFDMQLFSQRSPVAPPPSKLSNEISSDISIDLGWESDGLQEQVGIAYYLTTNQSSSLTSTKTLTVKDLLLTNIGEKVQRLPPHCRQELVLNEDEKRLLAKEGINLPSKLPLSKFEERVLKKIRRKIRNKRSAQESRKKKREYVDSLEERMSACSAHNLQLQRKIHQLEETNKALLEQLNQLQALLPYGCGKTANRGTCILVLLLSFSLLIYPNLKPDPYSQVSQGDLTKTKGVQSRSLLSLDEEEQYTPATVFPVSRGIEALCHLTEKLCLWTHLATANFPPSHQHDHRHSMDH